MSEMFEIYGDYMDDVRDYEADMETTPLTKGWNSFVYFDEFYFCAK